MQFSRWLAFPKFALGHPLISSSKGKACHCDHRNKGQEATMHPVLIRVGFCGSCFGRLMNYRHALHGGTSFKVQVLLYLQT